MAKTKRTLHDRKFHPSKEDIEHLARVRSAARCSLKNRVECATIKMTSLASRIGDCIGDISPEQATDAIIKCFSEEMRK